jgi:transposase
MEKSVIEFDQLVKVGCGIDVHEKSLSLSISSDGKKYQTFSFGTFTEDLLCLQSLLEQENVEGIAMESTGVYWKPVFNILSETIPILLVNARKVKALPGNKTDVKDSRWLCKLLLGGLLQGSFIPAEKTRDLRDLTRYQTKLDQQKSAQKNRIHKILEDCNIKLSSVLSDLSGVNAEKMIAALLKGDRSPQQIADAYHHKLMKASKVDIVKALTGKIREHHRFMLTQIQNSIENLEVDIAQVQAKIDELLSEEYDRESIELLTSIPGVAKQTAEIILAEIGDNMTQFQTERHLSNWAGVCCGNNETAGKKKVPESIKVTRTLKLPYVSRDGQPLKLKILF